MELGLKGKHVIVTGGGTHLGRAMATAMAELGGNFSLVAQGLGAYSERVVQPEDIIPAFRRAIHATESGRAALVEVMIKPMRTPEAPDDWSL